MHERVQPVRSRSVIAGLFVASSMPPWGWWPLAFIGVAMFHRTSQRCSSRRSAFVAGSLFGFAWYMPATAWMWFIAAPGWPIACLFLAVLHGAAEALTWGLDGRQTLKPLAHTLVEALRFSWPFGGIPLASLAISQADSPFAAIVRIGGAIALTWFVWQTAAFLAQRKRHVITMVLVATVALAFAPTGRPVDGQPVVRIALVQGGGPQGTRAINTSARTVHLRHLNVSRRIKATDKVDIVVWPENIVDAKLFTASKEFGEIVNEAKRLDVPILVGVTEDAGPRAFTNEQVVVLPDGTVPDLYEKRKRVPFGEYVPMRGVLRAIGAPVALVPHDATTGTTKGLLSVPLDKPTISGDHIDEVELATAISWEIFFGGRVNEGVELGGSIVINPTNGSSYRGTILQTQQVASSRLRAIESGRWVAQVSPTGFSAFVTNSGRVVERTKISDDAVVIADVPLRSGRTWYSRLGDAPVIIILLLGFAFALSRATKNQRRAKPTRR